MSTAQTGDGQRDEIETSLLGYLRAHPRAADTLEGIADWWLSLQRYATARTRVEAALRQLVQQGVLQLHRLPDGGSLYALTKPRQRNPRPH